MSCKMSVEEELNQICEVMMDYDKSDANWMAVINEVQGQVVTPSTSRISASVPNLVADDDDDVDWDELRRGIEAVVESIRCNPPKTRRRKASCSPESAAPKKQARATVDSDADDSLDHDFTETDLINVEEIFPCRRRSSEGLLTEQELRELYPNAFNTPSVPSPPRPALNTPNQPAAGLPQRKLPKRGLVSPLLSPSPLPSTSASVMRAALATSTPLETAGQRAAATETKQRPSAALRQRTVSKPRPARLASLAQDRQPDPARTVSKPRSASVAGTKGAPTPKTEVIVRHKSVVPSHARTPATTAVSRVMESQDTWTKGRKPRPTGEPIGLNTTLPVVVPSFSLTLDPDDVASSDDDVSFGRPAVTPATGSERGNSGALNISSPFVAATKFGVPAAARAGRIEQDIGRDASCNLNVTMDVENRTSHNQNDMDDDVFEVASVDQNQTSLVANPAIKGDSEASFMTAEKSFVTHGGAETDVEMASDVGAEERPESEVDPVRVRSQSARQSTDMDLLVSTEKNESVTAVVVVPGTAGGSKGGRMKVQEVAGSSAQSSPASDISFGVNCSASISADLREPGRGKSDSHLAAAALDVTAAKTPHGPAPDPANAGSATPVPSCHHQQVLSATVTQPRVPSKSVLAPSQDAHVATGNGPRATTGAIPTSPPMEVPSVLVTDQNQNDITFQSQPDKAVDEPRSPAAIADPNIGPDSTGAGPSTKPAGVRQSPRIAARTKSESQDTDASNANPKTPGPSGSAAQRQKTPLTREDTFVIRKMERATRKMMPGASGSNRRSSSAVPPGGATRRSTSRFGEPPQVQRPSNLKPPGAAGGSHLPPRASKMPQGQGRGASRLPSLRGRGAAVAPSRLMPKASTVASSLSNIAEGHVSRAPDAAASLRPKNGPKLPRPKSFALG